MEQKAKKQSTNIKKSAEKNRKKDSFGFPVFILAGEHSGDLLGGDLLKELKKYSQDTEFYGIGGEHMISEGFHSLEDMDNLAVIGFFEIIKKYSFLKSLLEKMVEEIIKRETKLVILIDYPGFNLRLAERLKEKGIRVVFYVSPQIWAWKFKRIFFIRKNVDIMLTLFQFEEDLYREYGVNAFYVGHPLSKRIKESKKHENPLPIKLSHDANHKVIGLLPGSRSQEIRKLTPELLKSAIAIQKHFSMDKKKTEVTFLLPNINTKEDAYLKDAIEKAKEVFPALNIHYAFQSSLQVMEASDLLLIASGTATLEATYFVKPMVIIYKVSLLSYFIGSLLIKTKSVGLVNILAGQEICRELLQAECKAEYITKEAIAILENSKYRKTIIDAIQKVKDRELAEQEGSRLAAKTIMNYFKLLNQ
ncbi:lipid-A-disaccharide synthase [Leptospira sp. GIMC2001]|uniref:lipid-A-disaccharide synthase n=1 Tax=Leptospira sp. GIMC2001 TaxID=1513297 RepID=UPI00234B823C|nr:lipid-A-disaccharide synthase [Leptospira sp. GIMC2001]WCL51175.1 lipid-A-disaccharide synthase [Leptospira sp. GIMC2001]